MRYVDVSVRFAGRSRVPTLSGGKYRPHFRVTGDTEYLGVAFVSGPEHCALGDEVQATAALIYDVDYSALQRHVTFDVLEGPTVVGTGTIVRRYEIRLPASADTLRTVV
jgi:hypothetical protein